MRPSDVPFLGSLGFTIVRIAAQEDICIRRQTLRGDYSLGDRHHVTEQGLEEIVADHTIVNNTTIENLAFEVNSLLERI